MQETFCCQMNRRQVFCVTAFFVGVIERFFIRMNELPFHRWRQSLFRRTRPGFDIDYKRLLEYFRGKGTLIRAFYYTALLEDQNIRRPPADRLARL